jgi:hypothetical protein
MFDYDDFMLWRFFHILRNCEFALYCLGMATTSTFQGTFVVFISKWHHHGTTFIAELHLFYDSVSRQIKMHVIKALLNGIDIGAV